MAIIYKIHTKAHAKRLIKRHSKCCIPLEKYHSGYPCYLHIARHCVYLSDNKSRQTMYGEHYQYKKSFRKAWW